jgi:hypothetical protein
MDDELRVKALAQHLGIDEGEIEQQYDCTFVVNPHWIKLGTSPDEARRKADLLDAALKEVGIVVENRFQLLDLGEAAGEHDIQETYDKLSDNPHLEDHEKRELTYRHATLCSLSPGQLAYDAIKRRFSSNPLVREMMEIGTHDLVNTLWFVLGLSGDHAENHAASLWEAFDGIEIVDRRKDRQADDGMYAVLTDTEADDWWNQELENYVDECILPELPEQYRGYFDSEGWKDAARHDGRGHSIASYDGEEHSIVVEYEDGLCTQEFFIYRLD